LFKIEERRLVLYADLSSLVQDELNDMVVDEQGQAYVGSYGFQNRAVKPRCGGSLVLVKPPGIAKVVATGLEFPNGCIITRDRSRLVLAETFGQRLTAFQIMQDGGLGEPTLFADLGKVSPDGICDDGEGGIWVAAAERPEFIRVLEGGTVTHRVNTPGRQAVACQLGGADGQILFCLTADEAFEDVEGCEASARLEVVQLREGR
jgi:sugar lactone lactonase YvrE